MWCRRSRGVAGRSNEVSRHRTITTHRHTLRRQGIHGATRLVEPIGEIATAGESSAVEVAPRSVRISRHRTITTHRHTLRKQGIHGAARLVGPVGEMATAGESSAVDTTPARGMTGMEVAPRSVRTSRHRTITTRRHTLRRQGIHGAARLVGPIGEMAGAGVCGAVDTTPAQGMTGGGGNDGASLPDEGAR